MLNCIGATRLMSDALDRRLTFRERMGLRMHLMACYGCRNYQQHMAFIRQACKTYAHGDADDLFEPVPDDDSEVKG